MRKSRAIRILAAGAAFLPAAAGAQDCSGDDGSVDWKVEGRFALFSGEDAPKAGDELLSAIETARGNLVDGSPAGQPSGGDAYETIVTALTRDGPDALYLNTHFDRSSERYRKDFLTPASYRVTAELVGETDAQCVWTLPGESVSGACSGTRLQIGRDWTKPAAATPVEVRSSSGRSARACILVEEKLIVGFGDSYASGEGNPDRPTRWDKVEGLKGSKPEPMRAKRSQLLWWPSRKGPLAKVPAEAGADAQWWDGVCHRSLLSQQALAAMAYAARSPHRVTTFLSFACSGATIVDGLVGPRVDTPGMGRLSSAERRKSPALTESQVKQAVTALCAELGKSEMLKLPPEAPAWTDVKPPYADTRPGEFEVPTCRAWRRRPDIMLLTIGGNDVGFGGVGWWAIVPPNGRLPLPADIVTWISTSEDRSDPNKPDFGVVCPRTYKDERRCRKSDYSAQDLAGQLPALQRLADEALAKAGLVAPVRIKTGYPPVTRDELGELCGASWQTNEYQSEPWVSAYSQVLSKVRVLGWELAAPFKDWTWGIHNDATRDSDCPPGPGLDQQLYEICEIDKFVLESLNEAVLAPRPGWANVDQDRLPRTHGICASGLPRQGFGLNPHRAAYLKEWGFPRWNGRAWNADYPTPFEWKPYARRPRWVRTANDSILTQAVFHGGSAVTGKEKLRLSESNSGSLHATVQMHAAYAELLVEKIEAVERERQGQAAPPTRGQD